MNIYEKAGDFLVDVAKLVIAGVLLAGIVAENINTAALYVIGSAVVVICLTIGFLLYIVQKRRK